MHPRAPKLLEDIAEDLAPLLADVQALLDSAG